MQTVAPQGTDAATRLDDRLIALWLHGKSANTVAAYGEDVRRFRVFVGRPLGEVSLQDLQLFEASLEGVAASTKARRLAAVKSLFAFAADAGHVDANVGARLRVKKPAGHLAARILAEGDVVRMLAAETDPRIRAIVRLLYVCGLRATEAAELRWKAMTGSAKKGGQARIDGKGGKVRLVAVPADLWRELEALTPALHPDAPVVPGRAGRVLNRKSVWRAVKRTARRARVDLGASPHWMRHSHASHALDNGASLAAVRDGLGHASVATTGQYLHARPGESSAAFIKG